MNHNELVGWAGGKDEYAVLIFRSSFEHSKNECKELIFLKVNFTKNILLQY